MNANEKKNNQTINNNDHSGRQTAENNRVSNYCLPIKLETMTYYTRLKNWRMSSAIIYFQNYLYMIKPFDSPRPPNLTLIKYMIRWKKWKNVFFFALEKNLMYY